MASLHLQQITERTYLIPSPANIGVYVNDHRAILIDSGNDPDAGRQILKLLKAQNWELDLIVNTHSNADHVGGNAFLQQKTGCRIAATSLEAAFIQHPVLEPAFLFGGFPMKALQNKFLMAKPSTVTDVIPASGPILNTGLEAMPLPGHYFEMIGVKTPDNVIFLADSLFSEEILNKYHLIFLYDLQAHFSTLEGLKSLNAAWYAPSHAVLTTDITALIAANIRKIQEILERIVSWCQPAAMFEELLARLCQTYNITLNANQYVLVGSTLKSCLTYLTDQGQIIPQFTEGTLRWKQNAI